MSIADELQKLEVLRASGSINDDEYARAKARVLNGDPATPAPQPLSGAAAPAGEANLLRRLTRSSRDRLARRGLWRPGAVHAHPLMDLAADLLRPAAGLRIGSSPTFFCGYSSLRTSAPPNEALQ